MFPNPPYWGGIGDAASKHRTTKDKTYILCVKRCSPQKTDCSAFSFDKKRAMLPFSIYNDDLRAPAFVLVRFLILGYGEQTGSSYPRCRSPPSDFDFTHSKNRNWRITHERNKSAGILPVLYK